MWVIRKMLFHAPDIMQQTSFIAIESPAVFINEVTETPIVWRCLNSSGITDNQRYCQNLRSFSKSVMDTVRDGIKQRHYIPCLRAIVGKNLVPEGQEA